MLTPDEETIIQRAATAQRDYFALVAMAGDDPHRRTAMLMFRLHCDAVARGDRRPGPAVPLWASLETAVAAALEEERPRLTVEVQLERQAKRLGSGCGLVQLRLGPRAAVRRRLAALLSDVPLSQREIADIFGMEYLTFRNHLTPGKPISQQRRRWYNCLEAVTVDNGLVHLTLRYQPTRKRANWRRQREVKY